MGEATCAAAVLHPTPRPWPCVLPPAVDDVGRTAGNGARPMGAAGLDDDQREAIREIVCDMLISSVAKLEPRALERGGGDRG